MPRKRKPKRKQPLHTSALKKADPVRIQVAIEVARVPGLKERLTNDLLRKAAIAFIETGRNPLKGVRVKVIRWINPSRKNPSLARWKSSDDTGENLTKARKSLFRGGRLRGLLHGLRFVNV